MTQTGPDLVGAGLPTSSPITALLGGTSNAAVPNSPARSNLEWFGLNNAIATNTLVASGVAAIVPVPVTPGSVVTTVNLPVTATAASVPTHQFAALYAGTGSAPALIAQTADAGSAAIAASTVAKFTYSNPVTLKPTDAPNGFVYVAISVTATTQPSIVSVVGPTTAAYGTWVWGANGPLFFSMTAGSALVGTAAATIASPSIASFIPFVYLT